MSIERDVEHIWNCVWLTIFPLLLAALSKTFLPSSPIFQLLILPLWATFWALSRPAKQALWILLWHAVLCETLWLLPPGACVTFFLLVWKIIRLYREWLPFQPTPYHGLLSGVILLPMLRLWIWIYAALWPTLPDASYLSPSFLEIVLTPAMGALGGSAIFALAQKTDFKVFNPKPEELRDDES